MPPHGKAHILKFSFALIGCQRQNIEGSPAVDARKHHLRQAAKQLDTSAVDLYREVAALYAFFASATASDTCTSLRPLSSAPQPKISFITRPPALWPKTAHSYAPKAGATVMLAR